MKIDQRIGKTVIDTAAATPAQPARAREAVSAGTTVNLSALSSQLHTLESSLAEGGQGFDAKRVESIKDAIRSGTFTVNPEAVADGLIASVRELVER